MDVDHFLEAVRHDTNVEKITQRMAAELKVAV